MNNNRNGAGASMVSTIWTASEPSCCNYMCVCLIDLMRWICLPTRDINLHMKLCRRSSERFEAALNLSFLLQNIISHIINPLSCFSNILNSLLLTKCCRKFSDGWLYYDTNCTYLLHIITTQKITSSQNKNETLRWDVSFRRYII